MRRLRIRPRTDTPPMFERHEPLRLDVSEPQPLREPLGVLDNPNAKSAEASDRVRLDTKRRFRFDHILEAGEEAHTAEYQAEEAAFGHHHKRRCRPLSDEKLEHFGPDALA